MNCDHGPEYRCFDCATDDELAAAIPPPADPSGHGHGAGVVGCPDCEDLDEDR